MNLVMDSTFLKMQLIIINPKSEARNAKQIQILKFECSKQYFEFLSLEF